MPYRPIDMACDKANSTITSKITTQTMETLKANSQAMIQNVLKRWKNLTKLKEVAVYQDDITPDLFKRYFLNRLGILLRRKREDAGEPIVWHLTIMHQVHDDLDLSPPWSMTKIQLPWMQEAIIPFWIPM